MNVSRNDRLLPAQTVTVPSVVWVVFISTLMAMIGGSLFGFSISGWAWVVPLVFSALIISINPSAISFPVSLWLPWVLCVSVYWIFTGSSGPQRSIQLACPIVVGMAASTYRLEENQVSYILGLFKYLAAAILVLASFRALFNLSALAAWAAHSMTVILLCSLFGAGYILGRKKDLIWWSFLAVIPFLALTRTAIVVTGLTLPLNFAPMKTGKRVLILILIALLGTVLFYTPRFQQKMFQQEGEGEMSDILHKDFSDSGRFSMWERMDEGIKEKLWFGHGVGAGEELVRRITEGIAGYPHNDWRLSLYDYGLFGTTIFAVSLLRAVIHAYQQSRKASGDFRLLFLAGSFSFVPFALLMYTDNIMIYASFFGNLQFTILGLAYSSMKKDEPRRSIKIRF